MRDIHNCKASSRAAKLVHRPLRNPRGLYWAENAISWEKHWKSHLATDGHSWLSGIVSFHYYKPISRDAFASLFAMDKFFFKPQPNLLRKR